MNEWKSAADDRGPTAHTGCINTQWSSASTGAVPGSYFKAIRTGATKSRRDRSFPRQCARRAFQVLPVPPANTEPDLGPGAKTTSAQCAVPRGRGAHDWTLPLDFIRSPCGALCGVSPRILRPHPAWHAKTLPPPLAGIDTTLSSFDRESCPYRHADGKTIAEGNVCILERLG